MIARQFLIRSCHQTFVRWPWFVSMKRLWRIILRIIRLAWRRLWLRWIVWMLGLLKVRLRQSCLSWVFQTSRKRLVTSQGVFDVVFSWLRFSWMMLIFCFWTNQPTIWILIPLPGWQIFSSRLKKPCFSLPTTVISWIMWQHASLS